MTTLIPVSSDLRRAVEAGDITLDALLTRLAEVKAELAPREDVEPPKPKQIVLSDADRKALRTLPIKLADLKLPESPRKLTETERNELVPLVDQVKIARAAAEKAEAALIEAMHNHLDQFADEDDPVAKNGHKITEGEVTADGYPKKVVRGTTGGKGVMVTDSDLQKMEADGVITHAAYLRMTKAVAYREPVSDAIMAELRKDPSLLDALADVATPTPKSTAIRMAKA